jgi:pimeloyl-ACP methyl ester carboxylesterase
VPIIDLPLGPIDYRVFGPDSQAAPTVVFVHGFLVGGSLWFPVAEQLALSGIRSIVPEWPLGAHRTPTDPTSELSPDTLATAVLDFLDSLQLHNVTLVGNDTGGAICQLALKGDHHRIGSLVLTNCDAFETFPPKFFVPVFVLARYPAAVFGFLQIARSKAVRHRSSELTNQWVQPGLASPQIRHDITRFARGVTRNELRDAKSWLSQFEKPTRIVWGTRDRLLSKSLGRRLVETIPHAVFVEVEDATTFVPIDNPTAVANVIRELCAGRT